MLKQQFVIDRELCASFTGRDSEVLLTWQYDDDMYVFIFLFCPPAAG